MTRHQSISGSSPNQKLSAITEVMNSDASSVEESDCIDWPEESKQTPSMYFLKPSSGKVSVTTKFSKPTPKMYKETDVKQTCKDDSYHFRKRYELNFKVY